MFGERVSLSGAGLVSGSGRSKSANLLLLPLWVEPVSKEPAAETVLLLLQCCTPLSCVRDAHSSLPPIPLAHTHSICQSTFFLHHTFQSNPRDCFHSSLHSFTARRLTRQVPPVPSYTPSLLSDSLLLQPRQPFLCFDITVTTTVSPSFLIPTEPRTESSQTNQHSLNLFTSLPLLDKFCSIRHHKQQTNLFTLSSHQ